MAGIRIDELDQTVLQSRDHVVPAMKDGLTVQLSVGQVLSLLGRSDFAGKQFAEDVAFDPGDGGPLVADNVQAAIEELLARSNEWRFKALFEPFPLLIDPDVDAALMPPKLRGAGDPIYVMLTANKAGAGQYNEDLLINQSVSGSGALVQATAEIDLPGSPKHGATIRLINTERRFLRAGEAGGIVENDAMQRITGELEGNLGGGDSSASGALSKTSGTGNVLGGATAGNLHVLSFDSGDSLGARVSDDETRVKNVSVVYFMRIH